MPNQPSVAGDAIKAEKAVISVHVRELNQLFNSMDPSPFLDKDLDVDAEEFIVSWAKELPSDEPLTLLVHLDRPTVVADDATMVRDSVHSFFRHRSEMTQQRLRQLLRRGRTSLIIGMLFLASSILVGDWSGTLFPGSRLGEIFRESLLIGGWVAMWRPMEIFLYDWWPILYERRIFNRLAQSAVRIVCSAKPATPAAGSRETAAAAVGSG